MKAITLFIAFLLLTFSSVVEAKTKIVSVKYSKEANFGVVRINLKNKYNESPDLTIKGNTVQVELPKSIVWPKIEKQFSLQSSFDSKIMAYQYNKQLVRVRAVLPYSIIGKEDQVSIVQEDKYLKLYFPLVRGTVANIQKKIEKKDRVESKVEAKKKVKDNYDETYLAKLLQDKADTPIKKTDHENDTESFLQDVVKEKVSKKSAEPEKS